MKNEAIVQVPIAPILAEPKPTATLTDEVLHGCVVEVLQNHGKFCRIKTPYGYEGFAHAAHLNFATENPHVRAYKHAQPPVVTASFADVVDGRHVKARVVATLPRGAEILAGDGAFDDYVMVTMADGLTYYMRTSVLAKPVAADINEDLRQRLIQSAKSYLGAQYRWGGRTPMGIDCSGLVFMAYWLNGITIWRDSKIVSGYAMSKISFEEAQPGDLVYFPNHVAMLIDKTDNKIIHSCHKNNGAAIEKLGPNGADARFDLYNTILHAGTVFVS